MSLKNVKEIGTNNYELELFIEKNDFEAAVTKAYKKAAPKITIPGFRKGKAPRAYVEKYYGKAYFYEEALDELLPPLYQAAIEESKLEAVSRPTVDVKSMDDDGVIVTANIWTMPVAKVDKYIGLEAEKDTVEIADEEIEHEIHHALEGDARMLTVEGAAEDGDECTIDFEGFLDGVAFEGGKGEGHKLVLGSHSFIPGFEEALIGHTKGEEFDINVTFPEDYGHEPLAGKAVIFKIKLHDIKRKELPELNDDFVKDVSDFDTVDEYRDDIKSKILARKQQAADSKFEEAIIDQLVENTEVEIPECMIEDEIDAQIRDFEYRLSSQGASLDLYYQYTGMTSEQLRESLKPGSVRALKVRLAVKEIIKAEDITASEEDIEAEYTRIAEGYKIEVEQVKAAIKPEQLTEDIAYRKAIELVVAKATVKQ